MIDLPPSEKKRLRILSQHWLHGSTRARWVIGLLGAVLIGAIGSGVWEMVVRPGLSGIARGVLTVLTFGSNTLRDAAYSTAALGAESLPALMLLYALALVPLLVMVRVGFRSFVGPRLDRKLDAEDAEAHKEIWRKAGSEEEANLAIDELRANTTAKLRRSIWWLEAAAMVLLGFAALQIYLSFSVLNQAVLIQRVFFANLAIAAPHLTAEQEELLRAQFSAVTTRAEYAALNQQIRQVADANGVRLREEQLW